MCLGFQSVLVVYDQYSILSNSFTACRYIHLRCLLSYRYGNYSTSSQCFLYWSQDFYHQTSASFLLFVRQNTPYQWEARPFGLATAPRVSTSFTKPTLFVCQLKDFCIFIQLGYILVLICSKHAGKRALTFLCSVLVWIRLHINFSKAVLGLTQCFSLSGLCWDTGDMSISLPSDKLLEIQHLVHSLLQKQPVTVHWIISFLGKTNFCANGHAQLCQQCLSFGVTCWICIIFWLTYFVLFIFPFRSASTSETVSVATEFCSFVIFLILMWLSPQMLHLITGTSGSCAYAVKNYSSFIWQGGCLAFG